MLRSYPDSVTIRCSNDDKASLDWSRAAHTSSWLYLSVCIYSHHISNGLSGKFYKSPNVFLSFLYL